MSTIDVPEVKSSDMIYHYCSLDTALNYILKIDKKENNNPELRLSPRRYSNDPIEKIIPRISNAIAAFPEHLERIEKLTAEDVAKLERNLISHFKNARQVCFCKNRGEIETIDDYGFLSPRMWDQYANKYHGVCLAFSKDELLKNVDIKLKGDIKYYTYEELEPYYPNINNNYLLIKGYEKTFQTLKNDANEWLFWKHKDYEGEDEYRIYTFTESKYDYINIENCLKGIIYPHQKYCKYFHDLLKERLQKTDIELLDIIWDYNGVRVDKKPTGPRMIIEYWYPHCCKLNSIIAN